MGIIDGFFSKKLPIVALAMSLVVLPSCAGRQASTISTYMPGDRDRNCESIHMEMMNIDDNMNRKHSEKNKTLGKNVVLGVAGAWLLVPWFFMDFSGTEKAEFEAYKNRYDYLGVLLADRNCGPYQTIEAAETKESASTSESEG